MSVVHVSAVHASVLHATGPLADVDEDTVTPGVLGFLVVIALAVVLVFLIRSMNKQISRIQAPKEADLEQADWDRRQAAREAEPGDDGARNGARNGRAEDDGTSRG